MATVDVSHKAASVCSSSKFTDSYVASFPHHRFQYTLAALQDQQRFFRASIEVWQRFSEFTDSPLPIAVRLAH